MVKVVVEFEYDAEQPDELSLRKGDIIVNVKKQDGGWWEGTLNGRTGVFPDNFVKEIPDDPPKKNSGAAVVQPPATQQPQAALVTGKNEFNSTQSSFEAKKANVNIKALGVGAQPPLLGRKSGSTKSKRARVTFPYVPEQPDEVELRLGDIVEIVKQDEEGWWEGIVNGKQGVFPSNFVHIIDEAADDNGTDEPSIQSDQVPKKVAGSMGYGDIFKGGQIQLKPAKDTVTKVPSKDAPAVMHIGGSSSVSQPPGAGKAPASTAQQLAPAISAHGRSITPGVTPATDPVTSTKKKDRARVLYAYQAENEDELTLEEGVIVTILDQNLEDPGWWKGELNGKIGVFPDNFVELIPSDDTPPPRPMKPQPVAAAAAKSELISQLEPPRKEAVDGIKVVPASTAPPVLPTKPAAQSGKAPVPLPTMKSQESLAAPKSNPPVAQLTPRVAPPEPRPSSSGSAGLAVAISSGSTANANVSTSESVRVIDELRREVQELKAALQKQGDMERELKSLRDTIDATRKEFTQRLNDVLREVDEEKKIRLSTQVDVERIKKLCLTGAAVQQLPTQPQGQR